MIDDLQFTEIIHANEYKQEKYNKETAHCNHEKTLKPPDPIFSFIVGCLEQKVDHNGRNDMEVHGDDGNEMIMNPL